MSYDLWNKFTENNPDEESSDFDSVVDWASAYIEQLQADNAQLREALEKISNTKHVAKSLTNPEPPTIEMLLAGLSGAIRMAKEALASTDSSNWLAEQKAQWRREVLEEAAARIDRMVADENFYSNANPDCGYATKELRRMAEQPESK